MTPAVQLSCNHIPQSLLPAISQRKASNGSPSTISRAATREAAPLQAPQGQPSTKHLEHAFESPAASPAQPLSDRAPGSTHALGVTTAAAASAAVSAEAPLSVARRNVILLNGDSLESTDEHRTWVAGGLVLFGSLFAVGASQVHDLPSAVSATAAVATAYLTSDLLSGVYHWGVDNYGDGSTPVFGSQIAGFQAHHQRPWTITEREFANNVHKVFKPAVPFAAACLAASPLLPPWACLWLSTATFFTVMSQQFHAWSHMKASDLPSSVLALQRSGLLISRKAHGAHHRAPFEGNYCIVSGFWNDVLDQNGSDNGAFRRLERLVHAVTGMQPRCWSEPSYEWEALGSDASAVSGSST